MRREKKKKLSLVVPGQKLSPLLRKGLEQMASYLGFFYWGSEGLGSISSPDVALPHYPLLPSHSGSELSQLYRNNFLSMFTSIYLFIYLF